MMVRQIVPYLLVALVCVAFAPASYASGVVKSIEFLNLMIDGTIYRVVPNGAEPGLADLSIIN